MRHLKKYFLAFICAVFFLKSYTQNVGINTTGSSPNVAAALDIDISNKGLLIPRIPLVSASDGATIPTPAHSLLVYNTGGTLVPEGYYYNQGTAGLPNWVSFLTNNINAPAAWSLTGNIGTTVGTHFLGTTDTEDFAVYTSNAERMRVLSGGNVGIGTTTPTETLDVLGNIEWQNSGLLTSWESGSIIDNILPGSTFGSHIDGVKYGYLSIGIRSNDNSDAFCVITDSDFNDTLDRVIIYARPDGKVGFGTTSPSSILHVRDSTPSLHLEQFIDGNTNIAYTMPGLTLSASQMNPTLAYTPAIKFSSTDPQFTTRNPKFLAGIVGRATEGYAADTDAGMALDFMTTDENAGAAPTPSVRMTIDDNGNVGIGATAPSYALEVNGKGLYSQGIGVGNANPHANNGVNSAGSYMITGNTALSDQGTSLQLGSNTATAWDDLEFDVSGITAAMIIKGTSGNVGIGTMTPSSNLHIVDVGAGAKIEDTGNNFPTVTLKRATGGSNTAREWTISISSIGNLNFKDATASVDVLTINTNGNVGISDTSPTQKLDIVGGNGRVESGYSWLTNSDRRYKKNITTFGNSLSKIMKIRGTRYDLISDSISVEGQGKHIGFIAQELEAEFPEFVVTEPSGYKSVAYDKMTAVLVNAIKEQQTMIEQLTHENKILSDKVNEIPSLKAAISEIEHLVSQQSKK